MPPAEMSSDPVSGPVGHARDAHGDPSLCAPFNVADDKDNHARDETLEQHLRGGTMRQIDEIRIRFIPQSDMRYSTSGDWFYEGGTLTVLATAMQDPRYQQLVAVHELVEALACNASGVTQESVDAFDMGAGADLDEPGNSPDAPYFKQHATATIIEKALAEAMGVDWTEYDAAVGDHGVKEY